LKSTAKTEMVFSSGKGRAFRSIRTAFTTACRNAKVADVSPHVLRHVWEPARNGWRRPQTIQELGGWKEIRTVERYADLSPSHQGRGSGADFRPIKCHIVHHA
jgi:integrase